MTDLGNGLLAISVPGKAEKFHFVNSDTKYICFFGADTDNIRLNVSTLDKYEILGTVTKDNISFDVEPYCEIVGKSALKPNTYLIREKGKTVVPEESFRSLLSCKGLYFENPCGKEPNPLDYLTDAFETDLKNWQQAENNLVQKLIILKRL